MAARPKMANRKVLLVAALTGLAVVGYMIWRRRRQSAAAAAADAANAWPQQTDTLGPVDTGAGGGAVTSLPAPGASAGNPGSTGTTGTPDPAILAGNGVDTPLIKLHGKVPVHAATASKDLADSVNAGYSLSDPSFFSPAAISVSTRQQAGSLVGSGVTLPSLYGPGDNPFPQGGVDLGVGSAPSPSAPSGSGSTPTPVQSPPRFVNVGV